MLYDFNYFKFFEVCFMAQNIVYFSDYSIGTSEN